MTEKKPHLTVAAGVIAAMSAAEARGESLSGFSTIDRPGPDSLVGADLGLGFIDPIPFDNDESLRVDLHGQYVLDNDVGLYGALPFSRLFLDAIDSGLALGNLEAGGYYLAPAGDVDFALRGGIALPTADSDFGGSVTNAIASSVRVTDVALAFPDTTWLRLAASPLVSSGDAFFRADFGLDAPLRTDVDADPMVRINAAGGLSLDTLSLLAELSAVLNADEAGSFTGDNLITGALTARFQADQLEPGVGLIIPISDAVRDVLDLGLTFSLQLHFE